MSVSIIVPCYNVNKYITRCLDSLALQTLTDIEIICVNDGSSDNTLEVLNSFCSKKNITIINKSNGGYGSAINAALELASSEYIAICESDDEVLPECYELLYKESRLRNLDVCFYNSYIEVREGFKDNLITMYTPCFSDTIELTREQIKERIALANVGITTCIFKKEYITKNNIKMDESSKSYEDVGFILNILTREGKIGVMPGVGYLYHKDCSAQSVNNVSKFLNIIKSIEFSLHSTINTDPFYKGAILGYCLAHLVSYYNKSKNTDCLLVNKEIKNYIEYVLEENTEQQIYIRPNIRHTLTNLGFKNDFSCCSVQKEIQYKSLPTMGDSLDKSYSYIVSYSHYLFSLLRINSIEIENNLTKTLNDILVYENCYHSRNDVVFKRFIIRFIQTITFERLSKLSEQIKSRLFLLLKDLNIITDLSYLKPQVLSGAYSESLITTEEWATAKHYSDFYHFYKNGNEYYKNFVKYIKGKSIVVVGNAPNILNSKMGKFIDSHDIVIRFNNYPVEYKLIEDLGYKTSVWVLTPALDSIYYKINCINCDYILCFKSNVTYNKARVNTLNNFTQSGLRVALVPCDKYLWENNVRVMSLGLLVAELLYENRKNINTISFVGFDLKSQTKGVTHYFKGDPSDGKKLSFHKWNLEEQRLHMIINKLK